MQLLVFIFVSITVCETFFIENRSTWEVRQYINSLGVEAPYSATAGELPFLVIVIDERIVMCNGVIVTDEYVLASSFCMQPEYYASNTANISQIHVLAGVHDTTDPKSDEFAWCEAKDLVRDSSSNSHLVLIRLLNPLNMTGLINGIALPTKPYESKQNCFAAGYIFTSLKLPIYQRKQVVDVYDSKGCIEMLGLENYNDAENSICLSANTTVPNNTLWDCQVDDGRIVFCGKTITGFIAHQLNSSCSNDTTFLYVDVGRFYDFFKRQLLIEGNKMFLVGERSFGLYNRENDGTNMFKCFCIPLLASVLQIYMI